MTIPLPLEAKNHIDQGHILPSRSEYPPGVDFPVTKAGFVHCSCGISFRVGVIVTLDQDEHK